jgi:hypothetical protein
MMLINIGFCLVAVGRLTNSTTLFFRSNDPLEFELSFIV